MSGVSNELLAQHRRRLVFLLTAGAIACGMLVITVSLVVILSLMGDQVGTAAVGGVAYVCLAVLLCDAVGLVVCGTLAIVALLDAGTTCSNSETSNVTD